MAAQETAWGLMANATMVAAAKICHDRGIKPSAKDLTASLKKTLVAAIPATQKEWTDATDAHMGEQFLRQLMNTQAWTLGLVAVDAL